MRQYAQLIAFGLVVATIVALAPTDVQAQKKNANNNNKNTPQISDATENEYAWASYNKGVSGTILSFDGGQSVSVRVTSIQLVPNPKYKPPVLKPNTRGYNSQAAMHHNMYQQYRNIHTQYHSRNPAQAMQQQMQAQMRAQMQMYQQMMRLQMQLVQMQMQMAQQIARANANPNNQPFNKVTNYKDFTFDVQDKAAYRKMYLPMEYDDQGNPKKYSADEKTALRGTDKSKPGYKATAEDVQVGATVSIYLTPPKKKAKTDDDDAALSKHATVNMIVLTKEASANSSPGGSQTPAPKKKN